MVQRSRLIFLSIKCVRPRLALICRKLTVQGLRHTPAAINVKTKFFKKAKNKVMYHSETLFTYCQALLLRLLWNILYAYTWRSQVIRYFLQLVLLKALMAKNPSVNLWAPMFLCIMQECGGHCFQIPARFLRHSLQKESTLLVNSLHMLKRFKLIPKQWHFFGKLVGNIF
jgi:hypothetical protein